MPITKSKSLSIEKLSTIVKPFVGSLKGKKVPRAILKTALITNEYIIATDSHRLIRIKHNNDYKLVEGQKNLHHYKKELTQDCNPNSYPDVSRLLPDKYNAQQEIKINIAEWLEAHELGLIAAKEHKNTVINLENNRFFVNPLQEIKETIKVKNKKTKEIEYKEKITRVTAYDQISFKYFLDTDTGITEKVAYNCEYMLEALKAMKKLGEKEATLYYYNRTRPMYFVAGDVEILILPVRSF